MGENKLEQFLAGAEEFDLKSIKTKNRLLKKKIKALEKYLLYARELKLS
ncbi:MULTISPECIES: hypothetical protein [Pseudothermotoga]|jgi:hypothetical protein|nr:MULTISPECIES: hypothetical protein [Pseudothermotoga]MDK2885078.1 hypothetical protein [Pseudothermotoga sp.]